MKRLDRIKCPLFFVGMLCLFSLSLSFVWADDMVLDQVHVHVHVKGKMLLGDPKDSAHKIDLTQKQYATFQDALRGSPSLQGSAFSGSGKPFLVSVRGTSTDHTGVHIDGVSALSPLELGRFDFSKIVLDDFESVTLKSGPYVSSFSEDSPAPASSPIGGTISLATKQGRGKPRVTAKTELGSLRSVSFHSSVEGEKEMTDFYVGASCKRSGKGRRYNVLRGNFVSDESFLKSLTTNVGHFFSENFEGRLIASTSQLEAFVDDFQGGVPTFSGARQRTRFDRVSPQLSWYPCDRWSHDVKASYLSTDYFVRSQSSLFKSHSHTKSFSYGALWHPQNTLTLSAGYQGILKDLKGSRLDCRKMTSHQFSAGLKYLPWELVQLTGQVIGHRHSQSGRHVTQSAELLYQATKTLALFLKEGQGIKFPTLVDIYGIAPWQQENTSLRPEKSTSYEAGGQFETVDKGVSARLSFFQNHIRNFIVAERNSSGIFTSLNRGKRILEGIEAKITLTPLNSFSVDLGYTYTRVKPFESAKPTVHLARHKGHLAVTYQALETLETFVEATYKSNRQDFDFGTFPESIVTLGSYTTIRAGVDYAVTEKCHLFGRLENAFNTQYEEAFGYGSRGREILIGFKVTT